MAVTSAAATSTNNGTRHAGTTARRTSEITMFVTSRTAVVARPSASPLTAEVVTASNGDNPSNCTNVRLLRQRPSTTVLRRLLEVGLMLASGGLRGRAVDVVAMLLEV